MSATARRIWISLVLCVAWIVITMFGARFVAGGETALNELVSTGIGWHFAVAIALLLVAIGVFRWNDMHFTKPHSLVRVMWFPTIYLVLFTGGLAFLGTPPGSVVVFVGINTLMVGASEEIMFRGVLFRAFEKAMSIWPAIILTSLLFGAVHALNVFITGELGPAIMQSVAAGMSGVVFMAIMIRTSSIWPAIIYHFLWDWLIFLTSIGASDLSPEVAEGDLGTAAMFGPILLNLPNMLFALILLRNVGKHGSDLQQELPA